MSFMSSIRLRTVMENVATLCTFQVGDKPISNPETGRITKEDRSWLVTVRRGVFGGFDPSILEATMKKITLFLQNPLYEPSANDMFYFLDHPTLPDQIRRKYLKVLSAISVIETTYRQDIKYEASRWLLPSNETKKEEVADVLLRMYLRYAEVYANRESKF